MELESIIGTLITPLLLIVFGWFYQKYPPKKINYLYGYRTRRSMANEKVWKAANELGAKSLLFLGFVLLFLGVLLWFLIPEWSVLISMLCLLLGILIMILWCEKQLDKSFDKNGNPKQMQ